jgi:hypothetical protein
MSDLKHARHLLTMANKDIAALMGMSDKIIFADEIFGFHAQQAAEKALKAWLAAVGIVYPLKHDLALLLQLLAKQGADVSSFKTLDDYTDFAVDFRYLGIDMAAASPDRNAVRVEIKGLLDHVSVIVAKLEVTGEKPL